MGNSKESVNDRVKEIRKTLKMTQVEFAKTLGIKGGSLSVIELGSSVTEPNIKLICTPNRLKDGFSVNVNWLRTGIGDMFLPTFDQEILDEEGRPLSQEEGTFIKTYRKLTPPNKEVAKTTVMALLKAQGEVYEKELIAPPAGIGPGDSPDAK